MARRSDENNLFQKNKEKEKEEFKRVINNRYTTDIEQHLKAKKITQDFIVILQNDGAYQDLENDNLSTTIHR